MAARAIIGILIGILFAPVIWLLLASINPATPMQFSSWFWSMTSDFTAFLDGWMIAGSTSMVAPIVDFGFVPGLITAFGPSISLLSLWLPAFLPALITWTVIGAWAGAIERSAGRGIGVGAGIWLGWLIIEMINMAILGTISLILDLMLAQLMTLMVVILVAAIFGAMTKSEEF